MDALIGNSVDAVSHLQSNPFRGLRSHIGGAPGNPESAAVLAGPSDLDTVGIGRRSDRALRTVLTLGGEMDFADVVGHEDGPGCRHMSGMEQAASRGGPMRW